MLKSVTSQLSVHADKSVPFLLFADCFSSQFYHNGGGGWHSAMSSVASPIQFRESVFLFQFRSSNQFRYFEMVCSFFLFRCLDSIISDPSGASSLGFVSSDLKLVQFLVLAAIGERTTCLKCVFGVSAVPLKLNVGLSFLACEMSLSSYSNISFEFCFCMTVCLTDMT